jgi:hypothetical protein
MADNQRTNLAGTIVKLYYTHWALFWRIMLPVAIVAIALHIAQTFHLSTLLERDLSGAPSRPNPRVYTVVSGIGTADGTHSTLGRSPTNRTTNTKSSRRLQWRLYPIPYFEITNSERITWKWEPKFGSFYYTPLILLLFAYCPLSLAIAHISRDSQVSDNTKNYTPLTAREMWRHTGRKALTVFAAFVLFILIVDVAATLYGLISWLIPSLSRLPMELPFIFTIVPHIYFLVTLSLYNPCLILEDNSIVCIFRRSHTLVSGARLRFAGIYLLTSWIASIITSLLLGAALLVFSIFIPDLAPIRVALFPLKFLILFIGGDIEVVLPQMLSTLPTVLILIVKGFVATFLVPIWAILTTHLYLERTVPL